MSNASTQKTGCFAATYPSTVWQSTQCVTAPLVPLQPYKGGTIPSTVGDGNDEVAYSSSSLIGSSVGSFQVSGLTSETDSIYGTNNYGLQVTSQFFTTNTTYTGNNSTMGWEQFVWINWPYSNSGGFVYIQYWLIGYDTSYGSCPSKEPPGGSLWTPYQGSCYANSPGLITPLENATNLASLSLEGFSKYNHAPNDVDVFCVSATCYKVLITDQVVNLYQNWHYSEFNVFGVGSGSQANFNFGTTITVTNSLKDQSGNAIVPSCVNTGYTGETNNLNLGSCSTNGNQIVFTESNPLQVGQISSVVSAGVGSDWFVLPDYTAGQGSMTHTSAVKCGGVKAALATDVYAGTYLFGALTNPQQNEILDTNSAYVSQSSSCGQPTTNPSQPLVTIAGPAVSETVYYYESVEKSSPLYYNYATGCITRRDTGVGVSCNFPSTPTKDVFVMEAFIDQAGRTVYITYGLNWPGTLAGYEYLVNFVLKNPSGYSKSWYVYQWQDAASGVSANSIPDPGDTYTQLATGP
jgi:hypothetical protein